MKYLTDWAPRLQPTTFVNIGGIQISKTPKKLPKDIEAFLETTDASSHGVILFTLGFIFDPKAVSDSDVQTIFDAFAQLPQKVVMKFNPLPSESTLVVPKNVLLKSFLPQQDILAHKNVVLFITHWSQSFTSLMTDLSQDINIVSSFSRCLNGTFP